MDSVSVLEDSAQVGLDIAELYGAMARPLEQIVRLDVKAPDVVIEDACQFAWLRLLHHRHRVHRESVLSWLAATAVHEAFKLLRRRGRDLSLELALDEAALECEAGQPAPTCPARTPYEHVVDRERLLQVGWLPERQQRLVWLHAFGLSYAEMAEHEDCTLRTVERQLLRAKHRLRATDG